MKAASKLDTETVNDEASVASRVGREPPCGVGGPGPRRRRGDDPRVVWMVT